MASRLVLAVFCLWLLHSSEAVKLLGRQEIPPIHKNCTVQEELAYLSAHSQDCRTTFQEALDLTNVQTLLFRPADPSHYDMLCSDACFPSLIAHIEGCHGANDGIVELFEGACHFNENNEMCYTATYNSLVPRPNRTNWQPQVNAECYVNFTMFGENRLATTCSDGCRAGLRQVRDELGCCLNSIYNNSFVDEHLPFAEYSLWSNCGLQAEIPGFCSSSASALFMGIYSIVTIIVLATLLWFILPCDLLPLSCMIHVSRWRDCWNCPFAYRSSYLLNVCPFVINIMSVPYMLKLQLVMRVCFFFPNAPVI